MLVVLAMGCGDVGSVGAAPAGNRMRAADSASDSGGAPLLVPVAMGITFRGGMSSDGALVPVSFVGDAPYGPVLSVAFVGAGYAAGDATDICWVDGTFAPPELLCDLPTDDRQDVWRSYEGTFAVVADGCAGRLDAAVWGPGGTTDLIAAIDGMHVGIGFGWMTDTLEATWSTEALDAWGDNLFAMYVAIHHPDGSFVGEDWSSALSWAWDEQTGLLLTDPAGFPYPNEPWRFPRGSMSAGYIDSYPAWFEPFTDLDFALLAVPPDDPCLASGDTGADTGTYTYTYTSSSEYTFSETDGAGWYEEEEEEEPTGCSRREPKPHDLGGCAHGGRSAGDLAAPAGLAWLLRRRRRPAELHTRR